MSARAAAAVIDCAKLAPIGILPGSAKAAARGYAWYGRKPCGKEVKNYAAKEKRVYTG